MTKLFLQRYEYQPLRTFGRLYLNGVFICDTLEDTYRDLDIEEKVPSKTCIPVGQYDVTISYSPKFKRRLPLVLNVKHFDGIRIHPGNTENDTSGCILVGVRNGNRVENSRVTFNSLFE